MIVVTHEMGFAKEVADQMIFMDEGMIVEKADTKEFFANPKSERTKLFLSQILQSIIISRNISQIKHEVMLDIFLKFEVFAQKIKKNIVAVGIKNQFNKFFKKIKRGLNGR